MSRTQRLFDLLQQLRCYRYPVSGQQLAQELNISLRTLYRDIKTLQAQGAAIEGEPGLGYVLRPGFLLPPLMFSEEEIEALVLGSRWVASRADKKLQTAANNVIAKIAAVLPKTLQYQLETSNLLVGPPQSNIEHNDETEALIRFAIRKAYKLLITYKDFNENISQRMVWPLALGFFEERHVIAAWCENKKDFRHFRTDRIIEITPSNEHYPERQKLYKQWRTLNNIPD